ncbi:MAG: hypothetical protein ACPGUC_00725 [Gammaproteobacteria bacterium]
MNPARPGSGRFSSLWKVALLLSLVGLAPTVGAAVLTSDDFTGNSGGMPAGWSFFAPFNAGSVSESGSDVTITDPSAIEGPTLITPGNFDPQGGVTTMAADITSLSFDSSLVMGIADASITNILVFQLNDDGGARLFYSNGGPGAGTEENLGTVAGYSGGAIDVTFTFDDDSFSVVANGGGFSTGDLAYSGLSSAFDFSAFGNDVNLALGMSNGTALVDSVLFESDNAGAGSGGGAAVPIVPVGLLMLTGVPMFFRRRMRWAFAKAG